MTTRETYISKMKLQLDDLNLQMEKLEAKAHEAREDVRDKYHAEMAKVRAQSKLAMAKLDELQASGESTWDAMVTETEKISAAFINSFHYFKSQV